MQFESLLSASSICARDVVEIIKILLDPSVVISKLGIYLIPVLGNVNVKFFECRNCIEFVVDGQLLHNCADRMVGDVWQMRNLTIELLHHFTVLWNVL